MHRSVYWVKVGIRNINQENAEIPVAQARFPGIGAGGAHA
jgi:hypothetical protein